LPGGAWRSLYLPAVVEVKDETENDNENETMFTTGRMARPEMGFPNRV
jgi:hypothetical protein